MRRTLLGDRGCFERIVTQYSPRLLRFIACRVPYSQDAEDICQETFLKAYQALHTFDLRCSFKTWLFTIAYHETVSFLRKKKVPACSFLPELADRQSSDMPDLFTPEEIWSAARCLGPDSYALLRLKYKEELSISEIAAVRGKSRLYIRVLLHRARKKLAALLQPALDEDNPVCLHNQSPKVPCSLQGESHVL